MNINRFHFQTFYIFGQIVLYFLLNQKGNPSIFKSEALLF